MERKLKDYTITDVIATLDTLLWLNEIDKHHWFRKRLNACRTEDGYRGVQEELLGKFEKVLH
jgi:hypothetical protein